jgi:hypothetical protein
MAPRLPHLGRWWPTKLYRTGYQFAAANQTHMHMALFIEQTARLDSSLMPNSLIECLAAGAAPQPQVPLWPGMMIAAK